MIAAAILHPFDKAVGIEVIYLPSSKAPCRLKRPSLLLRRKKMSTVTCRRGLYEVTLSPEAKIFSTQRLQGTDSLSSMSIF